MHLVMLVIVLKCFCVFVQSSIECLLEIDKMHRCQKALWEKNMVGCSPTSPDFIGFNQECSHEFARTNSGGAYKDQDQTGRGSIHTILNILVVCSFNVTVEFVPDCIFRLDWRLTRNATAHVLGWSHTTLIECSELRDDRLWLCNIESSRNYNAKVRMCNGKGLKVSQKMPEM